MKKQTIGVEIEMTGLTRKMAAKTVAKYFGTTANYVGGMYKAYEVKDNGDRVWSLMRDSSIRAEKKNYNGFANDEYKVELVTPILNYDDIETLQKNFTPQTIRNLINNIASKEDLLIRALNVHGNRLGQYCRKTNQRFLNELNEKKPETMTQLKAIWYNKNENLVEVRLIYERNNRVQNF